MSDFESNPRPEATQDVSGDAGHSELIAKLFREHNDALVRFLAVRLRSHQEAKEVAQEAYVRVLSLDRPGAVSFLRAFLFKTAGNLAIDRLRSRNRQAHATSIGLFEELRETPTPEREMANAQEVAILEKLIGDLPPKCRTAFLLCKIEGLNFAAAGAQMGLSERMVREYVMRAILYCRVGLDAAMAGKEPTHG